MTALARNIESIRLQLEDLQHDIELDARAVPQRVVELVADAASSLISAELRQLDAERQVTPAQPGRGEAGPVATCCTCAAGQPDWTPEKGPHATWCLWVDGQLYQGAHRNRHAITDAALCQYRDDAEAVHGTYYYGRHAGDVSMPRDGLAKLAACSTVSGRLAVSRGLDLRRGAVTLGRERS